MRSTSFIIAFLMFFQFKAQETQSNQPVKTLYTDALESFTRQEYSAAADLLSQYIEIAEDPINEAYYFRAVAELNQGNEEAVPELESIIRSERLNPIAKRGYFILGAFYFEKKDYKMSLNYLSQADLIQLSVDEAEFCQFGLGYAYLKTGERDQAYSHFQEVLNYRGAYFDQASYYVGNMYFEDKSFTDALAVLTPIDGKEGDFKNDIIVLISGIYFHTHRYKDLYEYAPGKITNGVSFKNKQLNKLLAEAYFEEKEYKASAQYFQRFLDLTGNRADAATFFKSGLSYFHLDQNKQAIDNFKKAGLENGDFGQLSSFYLAKLYLREKNLNFAYSAFKTVAQGDEKNEMSEEASFTMGKVNFERGQYADAIDDFNEFLAGYPSSRWKAEANELLAQSYLRTSNFDQAIAHLESIRNKSLPLRKAYQKVVFQKAQLLYNDNRFSQAIIYFEKAVQFPEDRKITTEAYYLQGESFSMLNKKKEALSAYKNCVDQGIMPYSNEAKYGMAYQVYNTGKDYATASLYFMDYLSRASRDHIYYQDALVRLADCYYVQKEYTRALNYYYQVTEPSLSTYKNYQQGLIYRLQGEMERAETAFTLVAQNRESGYGDNAVFQLAELYMEMGDFNKALLPLSTIINDYPESNLVPYARNQQALAHFNIGQYEEAKESYLAVLNNYINHEVANSALLGLQEVMKKGVDVSGFDQYLTAFENANPDDGSLEVVAFEAAKTNYYNQKYSESIVKLTNFRNKYPESGFTEDAIYFLADAYFRSNQWEEASATFQELIQRQSVAYTGRALDKRGKSQINLGKHKEAIVTFKKLLQRATNQKETFLAHEGLMNSYFTLDVTDSTLYYADRILESDWKPANAENTIWLLKAKIFLTRDEYAKAMDELIRVVNDAQNEKGAEAKYLMAKIYYQQKNYKSSLEILFDLNRNFGSYQFWVGKSFLLIADNYLAMDELLQAKATTESIVANASIEEIKAEAELKLETILKQEESFIVPDTTQNDTIR